MRPIQIAASWLERTMRPRTVAYAHCDLMCGVYDPAQARIEAESVLQAAMKYQDSEDEVFRDRCISIKEERADLVKHHLSVLWTDFFKPHHVEQFPDLHSLFWNAIKAAGEAKKTMDPQQARDLIEQIEEIATVFWNTEESKSAGVYAPSS
jgi:nickel superoxide dismutase